MAKCHSGNVKITYDNVFRFELICPIYLMDNVQYLPLILAKNKNVSYYAEVSRGNWSVDDARQENK